MEELKVETGADGVAVVTIDRAAKRNAMSLAMWRGMTDCFQQLAEDANVRVVILTGAGGCFSAGADISEFATVRDTPERGAIYEEATALCEDTIYRCPKPTVAAIDGFCVGGGLGLALCCDFRISSADGRFGIPAARLGIVYALGETQKLIAAVGPANAKQILFTGEIFDVARAQELGLLQQVVEGPVIAGARAFAQGMVANAPLSLAGAKFVVNAVAEGTGATQKQAIEDICLGALASEDYAEGRTAFVEKRAPNFAGR